MHNVTSPRYGNVTTIPISVRRIAKFNCHGNLYRCCVDDNRRHAPSIVHALSIYLQVLCFVQRDIEQGCARCINAVAIMIMEYDAIVDNYANITRGLFYIYIGYYERRCIMCYVAAMETPCFWCFSSFCVFADERDAIQKKTFTKWVNKHLKKVRPLLEFSDSSR